MDITLLLVRHPRSRPSPVVEGLVAGLGERARLTVCYPDEIDPEAATLGRPDLVVLKAKTPASLRMAGRFHHAGVRTLTSYPITELCRDKIATSRALAAGGVPVPSTYAVSEPAELAPLLDHGPLIVKPYRGSQGQGIQIIRTPADLERVDHGGDPVMAQAYLRPDGRDRKIYRIGEELFCVERIWPPRSYRDKLGRLVELDTATRQVALDCGAVLGIDLYGVDVIYHRGQPWVVDLSSFPGFKGVPDAARRLRDHILAVAADGR